MSIFKHVYKEGKLTEIQEYKDLRLFFMNKIKKRFQEVLKSEAIWEEEWGAQTEEIDIEKLGLKDLEMVKRDREYELFYIRQDDGKPFFNRNLLRHIKLVSDFDEMVNGGKGEDPLLRIQSLLDTEAQAVAESIREIVKNELGDFLADAVQHKEIPIVGSMMKLTMSLMLACNPQNLVQNTTGKMCAYYLKDFHGFLREVLLSIEYQQLVNHSIEELDQLSRTLLKLIHGYAYAFFTCCGRPQDFFEYYQWLVKYSGFDKKLSKQEKEETLPFFSDIFDQHDLVTRTLKKYPNGPLFKTLDIFRERKAKEGFDPLIQGNSPYHQFTFSSQSFDAKCLKMPCPTFHVHISKAKVVEEFKGFLHYIEMQKNLKRHLIFNLQDRTSWEEHARCQELEDLQNQAEFVGQLVVVTLPKKSDFYDQLDTYLDLNSAEDFIQVFEEQVTSGETCGFFFSSKIDQKELKGFIKKVLPLIHAHCFEKKKELKRQERLDFIEIFHLLLCLKVLDIVKPDTFSFTCKDGVDVGATMSAGFLIFIKLMSENPQWDALEQSHLLWVLNGAALILRERLVDYQRLSRMLSALSMIIESFSKEKSKGSLWVEPLFDPLLLQKIHCDPP